MVSRHRRDEGRCDVIGESTKSFINLLRPYNFLHIKPLLHESDSKHTIMQEAYTRGVGKRGTTMVRGLLTRRLIKHELTGEKLYFHRQLPA